MPISNPLVTVQFNSYQNLGGKRIVSVPCPLLQPNELALVQAALGKSFVLFRVTTSAPVRVRAYSKAAYRLADLNRPLGIEPTGEIGLILEVATTSNNLELDLAPLTWGANLELEQSENIPLTVTNTGFEATQVNINFLLITAEL